MIGYRNIRPIQSFQGAAHPLQQRQFHWINKSEGLSTALFAGQEMDICINDDEVTYQLTYLGMAHPEDFKSMDAAKEAAADFSRAVLLHMLNVKT
jgi:hypothetical protein